MKSTSLKNKKWYFINSGVNSGSYNMSFDNFILDSLIKGSIPSPVLRVYGWDSETYSIGTNQKTNKYPFVRRITGGQAVLHGTSIDELTYSVCLYFNDGIKKLYFLIGEVLVIFLKKYNLSADFGYSNRDYFKTFDCFQSKTNADIVVNNVKVIGSAQCKKKDIILQHGSIKLDKIRELSNLNITFDSAIIKLKESFIEKLEIDFLDYHNIHEKIAI